jgi:hypothetical protein
MRREREGGTSAIGFREPGRQRPVETDDAVGRLRRPTEHVMDFELRVPDIDESMAHSGPDAS